MTLFLFKIHSLLSVFSLYHKITSGLRNRLALSLLLFYRSSVYVLIINLTITMALQDIREKSVVLSTSHATNLEKPKKNVLDEDTYTEVSLLQCQCVSQC